MDSNLMGKGFRVAAWTLVSAAGLALLGCASRGSSASAPQTGADYSALYASGQYQAALEESSKAAGSMRAHDRVKASLIAGLSAQALSKDADAARYLTPLLQESDDGISGKAAAALGLMDQERGQHASAAELLATAAEKLLNDDKARAAMYAGDSYKAIGKLDRAKRMYLLAQETIRQDTALKMLVSDRLAGVTKQLAAQPAGAASASSTGSSRVANQPGRASSGMDSSVGMTWDPKSDERDARSARTNSPTSTPGASSPHSASNQASGAPLYQPPQPPRKTVENLAAPGRALHGGPGYSVQAGAFGSWNKAVARASELNRYGQSRIVEIRDPFGRRLYTVRLGSYSSEAEAEGLRSQLGRSAVVVPSER